MNYRTNFTTLLEEMQSAIHARALWDIYMSAAAQAGIAYGILFSAASIGGIVVQEATAHTAPPGWLLPDAGQAGQSHNPVLAHAMSVRRPFSADLALTAGDALHGRNGTSYAAEQTFVLPDFTLPRTSFIYLYGDANAVGELPLLHLAGLAMTGRMREIANDQITGPAASLSSREWECLQWASSGKTDWEIGEILHLSDKTVNEYVERAKHKLSVPTRIQAIVEGIRCGAIRI